MKTYENLYPGMSDVDHYEATRYATRDQKYLSQKEQERILELVGGLPAPRQRVLDAPCGYGRLSPGLAALGLDISNVDISTPMILRTCSRLERDGVRTYGVTADLFNGLPFRADSFDGAVSVRMLHNWPEREKRVAVLKSFAAVVADWVVLTYYADPLLHRAQFAWRKRFKPHARRSMAMISRADFASEAAEAGFRVEHVESVIPVFHAQSIAVLRKTR